MRPFSFFKVLAMLGSLLCGLNSQAEINDQHHTGRDMTIPAREISPVGLGSMVDDASYETMMTALRRQEAAFNRRSLSDELIIAGQSYPMSVLKDTLISFRRLFQQRKSCLDNGGSDCQAKFDTRMKNDFRWYRPLVRGRTDAHFTGYYSPTFYAKKTPTRNFQYGLYNIPSDPQDRALTRNDILFRGALRGKGLKLFYMDDPFELFLLHVEGGGVVETMENGQSKQYFLSYAGTNGQKFSFIGPYMRDQGYIPNASVAEQRKFLKANPDKWEEIYAQTPSYVYMHS